MNLKDQLEQSIENFNRGVLAEKAKQASPMARDLFNQLRAKALEASKKGQTSILYKSTDHTLLEQVADLFRFEENMTCKVWTDDYGLPSVCSVEYNLLVNFI